MQLLIYLYLITKTNYVPNPKIAGAYIDHICVSLYRTYPEWFVEASEADRTHD